MWKLTTPVLGYVLVVDALALVVVVATAALVPITAQALLWCGLILAGEVVHLEAAQRIERIRELAADGRPHMHLQSIWIFAGLLLLPPPLATLVIVVSYAHSWVRVYKRRGVIHRKVFSGATVILACAAAGAVLTTGTGHFAPYVPYLDGFGGMTALLASGIVYFGLNYVLVILAILMSNPGKPPRQAFGNPSDVLIVLAAVGVGCGIALVMTVRPWLLPVLMVTPVALHIGLLLPQFQAAARTDSKTSLLAPEFWVQLARSELARAAELSSTAGVLMIDIDHFKAIDDGNGHLAGDEVLRAVAAAIKSAVRDYDSVGRFGGEEFVVLLPDIGPAAVLAVAERIRAAIEVLKVEYSDGGDVRVIGGLSASIGVATYPDGGTAVDRLLQAADRALYRAKDAGRNQVVDGTATA